MRDRLVILGGLAVVLALVTWPAWRKLASSPPPPPDLARPVDATGCVEPVAFMRASHMVLLAQWRDRVVRDGIRTYVDGDGRVVTMSLSGTCLGACHTDATTFCDRCHNYAGVSPGCRDCHVLSPAGQPVGGPR